MTIFWLRAFHIYLLAVSLKETNGKIKFTSTPRNYTVIASEDNTVVIHCKFTDASGSKKTWINGSILLFSGDERFSATRRTVLERNSDFEYSLRISKVNPYDEGEYTCMIYDSVFPSKQTTYLTVNVPAYLTSDVSDQEVIVNEGDDVWLKCIAGGRPRPIISWRHLVPSGDGVMGTGTHLPLRNIKREHEGLYECSADNNMGSPQIHTTYIYVRYPPEMHRKSVQKNASVAVGQGTVLECTASAYPRPEFVWKHGDVIYRKSNSRSSRVQVITALYRKYTVKSKLNIDSTEENDFGSYQCIASNAKGKANMSLYLQKTPPIVTRKPPYKAFNSGNDKRNGENGAFQFHELTISTIIIPLFGLRFLGSC